MTMYFNGCSFTYGDELQYRHKDAYPVHVASQLASQYKNDAVSGGTNERTVYRTLQHASGFDSFVIAWTSYARFTEYNPVDNFEINFTPALNLNASLHFSNDLKINFSKYKDYGEMYYRNWYNDLYQFKKWLQQIILLQSFFHCRQKKYLMLNTVPNNLPSWLQPKNLFIESCRHLIDFFDRANNMQLLEEHKQIHDLIASIDTSKFIEWNDWCITDLCRSCAIGPGGHILETGHRIVAEKVLAHVNTLQ